jgi:hypothetical protein
MPSVAASRSLACVRVVSMCSRSQGSSARGADGEPEDARAEDVVAAWVGGNDEPVTREAGEGLADD